MANPQIIWLPDNRHSYYCKELDYYNIEDVQYWKYKIATIDRNIDSYNYSDNVHVVYGKLYAYNKFEDYTGGPYYFRVLIYSEKRPDWAGEVRDCEIRKKESSFSSL